MKRSKLFPIAVFALALLSFVLTACANEVSIPDNLIEVVNGATTRGGFTISRPDLGEHGRAFGAFYGDIGELGYIEEEFFIEGTAQRYEPVGKLGKDGKWTLQAISTSPYKTRFIVRRPINAADFNGTVVIEWTNVSGGFEMSIMDSPGIYKEGFAYVTASLQMNGLYGFEENPMGLTVWDNERYGDLNISDDGLSYDIYTQIARSVGKDRNITGIDPMGGLEVKKIFAAGASQSGSRVLSYANGVQPIEKVFDAIVPVVNSGRGTDFGSEISHIKEGGKTKVRNVSTRIREDINCKAFIINTQTESNTLGNLAQPDTDNIVSWQIAGAAHLPPQRMLTVALQCKRDGVADFDDLGTKNLEPVDWTLTCEAALVRIIEWIDSGKQPLKMEPMSSINMIFGYWLDNKGNVKGGVRLPEISVPIATYDISLLSGSLYGNVYAFSQQQILELYPIHQAYINQVTTAASAAVEQGIILPYAADEYIEKANANWVATLWTDAPAIELVGSGNSFNMILFIFIAICVVIVALITLIVFLTVRKIRKKRND